MRVNIRQLVVNTSAMMIALGVTLFLPAGTLAWPAGWIFFLVMLGFAVAMPLWLLRFNPDLLAERLTGIGRADQKRWDKVFLALTAVVLFVWLTVMALDAVRFRRSRVPLWVQAVGALLLFRSFYISYLPFRENTYLSPAARIQKARD